jgi:hypothetical protein
MYSEHDMDLALTEYMDAIQSDYSKFGGKAYAALNITINRGSKFYKVVVGTGVHSFVCRKAHDQWKVGDVLKAASWAQPAKNFVRGNVLTQQYINPVRWAGI